LTICVFKRMKYIASARFMAAAMMISTCVGEAAAQQRCDPALTVPTGTELGYRLRGERCEGVYAQGLSAGSELTIIGLMARASDLEFRSVSNVQVRWRPVAGQNVRIQAHSLRWRTYYRMDTVRPGTSTVFRWPTSILGPLQLRQREIAVLAWIDVPGSTRGRIHLPIRMDTASQTRSIASYQLTVVPGTDFSAVRMTLRRRTPDGSTETIGNPDVELGLGSYPARRPFPVLIPLRGTLLVGEYEVELTGQRTGGGWASTSFRFRHGTEPL
jgi:hypothetical protein